MAASAEHNDALAQAILHTNRKAIHQQLEGFLTKMTQAERFTGVAFVMRSNKVIHAYRAHL